jgi:hypothetical protein
MLILMMEDLENMKTLSDWFEYLDEPFVCSDAFALFEDLNDLISNQSDIGARIEGRGSGGKRQQAEAYYELVIGKDLQRLAKERNYDLKYELEYGDPCSKKKPKPDWTVIDGQERFVLELVTKHKSDHDLVLDTIDALIRQTIGPVGIHYTGFPTRIRSEEWKFSPKCLDCKMLNLYISGLIHRIEESRVLQQDVEKKICIDGMSIDFTVNGGKTRLRGGIPHRYMLSIAEKARKLDAIAEKYPVIIGVTSTKHLRAAGMTLEDMTKKLYGEICECIPGQLNLCLEDYCTIVCGIPSLRKVTGIMFYHLKYIPKKDNPPTNEKVILQGCEYFKNPHYEKEYPMVLESYIQRVSNIQDSEDLR